MPRISRPRRRGSALVIVLGVLSVLMLMAIAFSTFVRTERGGSTNIKNAFVARSALDTALGRAMESIDLAFGSADNDDPVAPWPFPWLASAGDGDHYQCAALGDNETAEAHVLTAKIAEYLTPAQLALVKSAKCGWAPIKSSISASPASPSRSGRDYGDYGRPSEDSLIGRYAFVALDTTGLLDMNQTGIYPGDRDSNSGDPATFDLPDGPAKDSGGKAIPRFVKNETVFLDTRDKSKKFYSMADAKAECAASVFNSTVPTAEGGYYPADLFAGFAPSLAELDPEGNPKIQIPRRSELQSWAMKDWTALVRRTFRAMIAIFARGRVSNGTGATSYASDQFTIFQNCGSSSYQLSRAALATVALLDGLDADFVPGKAVSPTCNYWPYLCSQSSGLSADVLDKNGSVVSVSETVKGDGNPLNYPCTESAPLLSSVFASIEINPSASISGSGNAQKKIYRGTLHIGARAVCQNKAIKSSLGNDKITLEWEVMSGTPRQNTVTGDNNSEDIRNGYVELKAGSGFTSGKNIEWKDFFGVSGTCPAAATTVSGRQLTVRQDIPFQIICSYNPTDSRLVPYGGFYPPTQAELNGETGDVLVPIRMKVTISGDGGTIQQVPAPAIASGKDYWLRVSPAVYHGKSSRFGGKKGGSPTALGQPAFGSLGELAWGWAICAVPAFGFDTGSLVTLPGSKPGEEKPVPATMNFWINDIVARNAGGGGGFHGGGQVGNGRFSPLVQAFFIDSSANDQARREFIAGGFRDPIWNYAQLAWLFKRVDDDQPSTPYGNVVKWMNKSEGRHMPDMLHCAKKGGNPFVEIQGTVSSSRLAAELYSQIPANGYQTAADLGTVMCGPYETLSLFRTWRYGGGQADFHPVVDYFTTDRDRYPDRKEITAAGVTAGGDVNWTDLSGNGSSSDPYKDLYSAVHSGRVNLNAPPLVEASKIADNLAVRGDASAYLNPYPIAAVFNGAPFPGVKNGNTVTNTIDPQTALILATDFCRMLEDTNLSEAKARSDVFDNHERNVVRNLSFLGAGDDGDGSYKNCNTLLEHFINATESPPRDDNERESLIRGTIDGFTTRGQTYLLILRADAYTPRFGMDDDVRDGTTLSTTHAIVELFRDPVPARAPDGSLPSDGSRPVAYHNWYVRSFRVF